MTMTPEQRAQLRAICDSATPGPLITSGASGEYVHNPETNFNFAMTRRCADALFIAHARTALPAALDTLDAEMKRADEAETRAEVLEQAIKKVHSCVHCIHGEIEYDEEPCSNCFGGLYFQFDTARFTSAT